MRLLCGAISRRAMPIAIAVLLVVTLTIPIQAKEQPANYPPSLRASDILTDAAQVVQAPPLFRTDKQARVLYYLEADRWSRYLFPPDVTEIDDVEMQSDGSYLLKTYGDETTWHVFEPRNGTISPVPVECGVMKNLPGEGRWVFYQTIKDGSTYFCFTENGTLSSALPSTIDLCGNTFFYAVLSRRPVYTSPDKKWILFSDCHIPSFSLYSYNIATQQVNFLGTNTIGDDELVELKTWADATHSIIFAQMSRNESMRSIFLADITKPNSLQVLHSAGYIGGNAPNFVYQDKPPRYSWVPGEFSGDYGQHESVDNACSLHEFDFTSLRLKIYTPAIPDVCGFGVPIPDGSGDMLYHTYTYEQNLPGDIYLDGPGTSYVLRFNFEKGTWQGVYTGPVSWIESVSPDGTYAALVVTDPAEICCGGYKPPEYGLLNDVSSAELKIIRLKDAASVFQMSLSVVNPDTVSPTLDWLDDNDFSLTSTTANAAGLAEAFSIQIGHIGAELHTTLRDSSQEEVLTYSTQAALDQILHDNDRRDVVIYDPAVRKIIPVICGIDTSQYSVDAELRDDGLVDIKLYDAQDQEDVSPILRHWVVRVLPKPVTCMPADNVF